MKCIRLEETEVEVDDVILIEALCLSGTLHYYGDENASGQCQ